MSSASGDVGLAVGFSETTCAASPTPVSSETRPASLAVRIEAGSLNGHLVFNEGTEQRADLAFSATRDG